MVEAHPLVAVTDEVKPGTVAVPHGWGPSQRWLAGRQRGRRANVNLLASSDPDDLERLAGMAFLNGIPVRLERVERERDGELEPSAASLSPGAGAGG